MAFDDNSWLEKGSTGKVSTRGYLGRNGGLISQQVGQFRVIEPNQVEIEVLLLEGSQLQPKRLLIPPGAVDRQLVIGNHQSPTLGYSRYSNESLHERQGLVRLKGRRRNFSCAKA